MDIMLVKTKMHPTLDTKRFFNIAFMRIGVIQNLPEKIHNIPMQQNGSERPPPVYLDVR